MLEYSISRLGRITIVEAKGRIDGMTANQLLQTLTFELENRHARIILDLAGVDFMSGAGVRVLKNLSENASDVRLARPSDRVREVLQISGMDVALQIHPTRTGAIRAISPIANAHTHLELGWLAESCPGIPGVSFVDWMLSILPRIAKVRLADWETVYRKAAEAGIQKLLDSGTTVIGDVSSEGLSIAPLMESGLSGVVYVEVLAFNHARAEEKLKWAQEIIDEWRPKERNRMHVGLALHAPYSVHRTLWDKALDYARREAVPLTIHVAESKAEHEYMTHGTGDFVTKYYPRLDLIPLPSPKMTPIRYLEDLGALELRPLLAHAVHVDDEDVKRIQASGARVVHCPRSNLRLRCGRMPLEKYLEQGVPVFLGTDSLGSSPSINIFDELEVAAALHHGRVAPEKIEELVYRPSL
jgi:5-methylthioadenosine/S-adenosylhomocysteine deaminase